MLSLIILTIAYFIDPSDTSFLIALLLASLLDNLRGGHLSYIIPEAIVIFLFAPTIYTKFMPESFIGFVGIGILIYLGIQLLHIIIDIVMAFL